MHTRFMNVYYLVIVLNMYMRIILRQMVGDCGLHSFGSGLRKGFCENNSQIQFRSRAEKFMTCSVRFRS